LPDSSHNRAGDRYIRPAIPPTSIIINQGECNKMQKGKK